MTEIEDLKQLHADLCDEVRTYRERITQLESELAGLRDERRWQVYLAVLTGLISKVDVGALIHAGESIHNRAKDFVNKVMGPA